MYIGSGDTGTYRNPLVCDIQMKFISLGILYLALAVGLASLTVCLVQFRQGITKTLSKLSGYPFWVRFLSNLILPRPTSLGFFLI